MVHFIHWLRHAVCHMLKSLTSLGGYCLSNLSNVIYLYIELHSARVT